MGKMFSTICLALCLVPSSLSCAGGETPMSSEEEQKEVLQLAELSTDDLIAELEKTASKAKLYLHETRTDILISLMAQELSKRGERKSLIILYKICDEGKTHAVVDAALSVCRIEIKDKDASEKVKILEKLLIHEKSCFQYASAQILKELNSEKALIILKKYAKTNGFAKKSMLESEVNSLSDEESAKRLLEVLKTDVVEGNMTYTIAYNILIDMGRKGKKISSPMLTTLNSLKDLNISKENKEKLTDLIVNGIYIIGDKEVIERLTEDQKKYWYKQEERRKKLQEEITGQKKERPTTNEIDRESILKQCTDKELAAIVKQLLSKGDKPTVLAEAKKYIAKSTWTEQLAAVVVISELGSKDEIRELARLFDSEFEVVREEVAQALQKAGFKVKTIDKDKKKYKLEDD